MLVYELIEMLNKKNPYAKIIVDGPDGYRVLSRVESGYTETDYPMFITEKYMRETPGIMHDHVILAVGLFGDV